MKQIIWDLAATAGAENLTALRKDLDYKLEELRKNKSENFSEGIPDIRKIQRIIELDINRLPPEVVVTKLPSHVWRLRHDYEEIKELADSMKREDEVPEEARTEAERYKETARLSIDFDPERSEDQGIFGFVDGGQARFCRVRVYNRGGMTAQKCAGKLMILPPHDKNRLSMYNLHWVFDDPYLPTDRVRPIDILPKDYCPLDVAFALPPSQKDVSKTVSGQTTTSGRIFASSVPGDTKSSQPFEVKLKGCWIATHLALVTHKDDQYHLSSGEYFVKVEVHYSGVEVEAKCFKIISPSDWHNLKMELVECPQAAE